MKYHILTPNTVKRDIRKLSRKTQEYLLNAVFPLLEEYPRTKSERLTGKFSSMWKYKFTVDAVSYRVLYEIVDERLIISLVLVGTRENIYKELKRRK